MKNIALFGSIIFASLAGSALAYEALPATAKPMSAADLKTAYSGKSIVWKDGSIMYWSPDGKVMGYSGQHNAIADGTWDTVDGKVCNHASWMGIKPGDTPYLISNCWGYMVDGKRIYYLFTSDKMTSDTGWWGGGHSDLDKLKSGNLVLAKYDVLKKKMP